jgi:hypothetical protein
MSWDVKGPVTKGWRFDFGKHRGEAFIDVVEEDPGYVEWCLDEVVGFAERLDPDYLEEVRLEVEGARNGGDDPPWSGR